jgi:hypothetical protein
MAGRKFVLMMAVLTYPVYHRTNWWIFNMIFADYTSICIRQRTQDLQYMCSTEAIELITH